MLVKRRKITTEIDEVIRQRAGTIPDVVLARELGLGKSTVSKRRRELGIAPSGQREKVILRRKAIVEWLSDQWESVTSRDIQEHFGIGRQTVNNDLHAIEAAGLAICIAGTWKGERRGRNPSYWVAL